MATGYGLRAMGCGLWATGLRFPLIHFGLLGFKVSAYRIWHTPYGIPPTAYRLRPTVYHLPACNSAHSNPLAKNRSGGVAKQVRGNALRFQL